jgi:general secretion pathway protein A
LPGRSRPVSIGVDKLARYFPGEFATFWRAPPDYRPILAAGERGAHIDWLAAQLARLHGNLEMPPGQAFGPALAQQIREFQATQGLIPDGVAGPHTMMALNQATSVYEPRLGAIWTSATNSAR